MYVNELTFTTGFTNELSDLLDCRKQRKDKNAAFLIFCSYNVTVTPSWQTDGRLEMAASCQDHMLCKGSDSADAGLVIYEKRNRK